MSGAPHRIANAKPLSIGALSRATGIPAETLRTWERRYGSPKPTRKPSGHRLYPAVSVERLRRVVRLLTQGHRPADVLNLSVPQLDSLLLLNDRGARSRDVAPAEAAGDAEVARIQEALIRAARGFDRESLMHGLRAAWGRLGPLRFLEDVAGPFMAGVGNDWESGRMEIRHEHFASGCLSDFLREIREPFEREARGARVAAALLPGDTHEGGLLMTCAILSVHGYRVIYLGADMPIEQVAATVASGGADVVAISVSASVSSARAERDVRALRRALPKRVPIWMGGAGAPEAPRGVERFPTLTALAARIGDRSTLSL